MSNYSISWDLNSLNLEPFKEKLDRLQAEASALQTSSQLPLSEMILKIQNLDLTCHSFESYVLSRLSEDVKNNASIEDHTHLLKIRTSIESLLSLMTESLAALQEEEFGSLLEDPRMREIAFYLNEKREWAKELLPFSKEEFIQKLGMNGYQGWNDLYSHLTGRLTIPVNDKEGAEKLSLGRAENQLSNSNRSIRQEMFKNWEKAWEQNEETFALILNHLAGFRLETYALRQWDSFLKEPLHENRLQEETLQKMWKVVGSRKEKLKAYLAKKAACLQVEKPSWFDVDASLFNKPFYMSYQDAAELIIQEFNSFSPSMGAFAQEAFQKGWIEAEDRAGKRPGGYCASFPTHQESRIFMTYNGTMANVFTLAHELGHAYHNHIVDPLPRFAQNYKMNVAETASTLAECIIIDALIRKAKSDEEKKIFIDYKVHRAVLFLMNIHARFLFEKAFYEERKKGYVQASRLNQIMEASQKEAFGDGLSEWHPRFWASKLHFYYTDVPFYNFPYTFGYLFSYGTYQELIKKGPERAGIYENLLRDTGRMTTEDLAKKHLGIQLQESAFWERTIDRIDKEINELL
ncbi:MAG: M3 family oligoendopeptidase [Parachlamydia sp.]|jgi:pepF/M3 family oligoendopeptidase|nr:M3 family oligoendopeptidase [Parachlamydia sp.]